MPRWSCCSAAPLPRRAAPLARNAPGRAAPAAEADGDEQLAAAIARSLQDAGGPPGAARAPRRAAQRGCGEAAAAAERRQGGFGANNVGGARAAAKGNPRGRGAGGRAAPAEKFEHNLTVPKRLEEKSVAERLRICARRLAGNPAALRTLRTAVENLSERPDDARFRRFRVENRLFAATIGSANGGVDFLKALGFELRGGELALRGAADPRALSSAMGAIDHAMRSTAYLRAAEEEAFREALAQAVSGAGQRESEELLARAQWQSIAPREPGDGAANVARVSVQIGEVTAERRFAGDDTLGDVVHFLGGYGSAIPDRLLEGRWALLDVTTYPPRSINVRRKQGKTLQACELWPSAQLRLALPSDEYAEDD